MGRTMSANNFCFGRPQPFIDSGHTSRKCYTVRCRYLLRVYLGKS
jgi:hypothetical protein